MLSPETVDSVLIGLWRMWSLEVDVVIMRSWGILFPEETGALLLGPWNVWHRDCYK